MSIPKKPWSMMIKIYKEVLPRVHHYLQSWTECAKSIPDLELRKQALSSIQTKTFHCEGGSIYGLLAGQHIDKVIKFIVAYQTISDYLDNLCDRSTSQDPDDFQCLHQSMKDALTPTAEVKDYYQFRVEKDDGGYLHALVKTCQSVLAEIPTYDNIYEHNIELANYYCDLQIHKHVKMEERVPRLESWFQQHQEKVPKMSWYEFSACAGSTLGIFCMVAYAMAGDFSKKAANHIKNSYFPWVQGLHIMLDYFIDQDEDRKGGDLNFCFYYEDDDHLHHRLEHFAIEADNSIRYLPDSHFHSFINKGLLAIYLADEKVRKQKKVEAIAKRLIKIGGGSTWFFFLNSWVYRRMKK